MGEFDEVNCVDSCWLKRRCQRRSLSVRRRWVGFLPQGVMSTQRRVGGDAGIALVRPRSGTDAQQCSVIDANATGVATQT
jgi:hypothetical protein